MNNELAYYCTLADMNISVDQLKDTYEAPFSSESAASIELFVEFYNKYLKVVFDDCVFYQDSAAFEVKGKPSWKLYGWYKKHIDAMIDIKAWYEANRAALLSNEMKSTSTTKSSDTPQDGTDYTDDYPTTQMNVENSTQSKDNISFLNGLAKKYHNYMADFVTSFVKECGLYWDVEMPNTGG